MKKVKSVEIRFKMEGHGIVNYDSSKQRHMYNGTPMYDKMKSGKTNTDENIIYAQKEFFTNENGELDYNIIISSNCLGHSIFQNYLPFHTGNSKQTPLLIAIEIASPRSLLSGYLYTNKKDSKNDTLKRKSPLSISPAREVSDSVSHIQTFSNSGEKGSNSFYFKETMGDTKYVGKIIIDIQELQFLSLDQIYDRFGLNPDHFQTYKEVLQKRMPTFKSEPGYYKLITNDCDMPVFGIKFSDDDIVFLVKFFLKELVKTEIKKKGEYAAITKVEYSLQTSVFDKIRGINQNWIDITSENQIEDISFSPEEFYVEQDRIVASKIRAKIVELDNEEKARAKEKSDAQAEERKRKKELNKLLKDQQDLIDTENVKQLDQTNQ